MQVEDGYKIEFSLLLQGLSHIGRGEKKVGVNAYKLQQENVYDSVSNFTQNSSVNQTFTNQSVIALYQRQTCFPEIMLILIVLVKCSLSSSCI